jgi:hypothetical protein
MATTPAALALVEVPLPRKNLRRLQKPEVVAGLNHAEGRVPLPLPAPDKVKAHRVMVSAKDTSRPPGVTVTPNQKRIAAMAQPR